MEAHSNVVQVSTFESKKRHTALEQKVQEHEKEIKDSYKGHIKRYLTYCEDTGQQASIASMLDYLEYAITEQKIKKTTWELRLVAIRRYLAVTQEIDFQTEAQVSKTLKYLRKLFEAEGNEKQLLLQGKSAIGKQEVLDVINGLPVREKAITLVNLITANRPSEMVRLKVEDFDLDARTVNVWLKKQKTWHNKRITQEVVKAVKAYIRAYKLKPSDYFVGRVYKGGIYASEGISEIGYTKSLQKWTGLTAYNFRKSQVVSMHENGADLPTIAKQTGHKSLEVLSKHYLSVSHSTVDKYL